MAEIPTFKLQKSPISLIFKICVPTSNKNYINKKKDLIEFSKNWSFLNEGSGGENHIKGRI